MKRIYYKDKFMLQYAALALIVAIVAFVFGFVAIGLVTGLVWIAKIVFVVALIAFIGLFIMDMVKRIKKKT
jgi:uncharacterized membrane protein YtjA (UPF0391 family)